MRDDHFDPQHLDEQINQCLGESGEREPVATQVIRDLQQEYLPEDSQEALQRVWQRITSYQTTESSTGSAELAQQHERPALLQQRTQQRRKRFMQSSPTSYEKGKPRLAILVGIAASILIIGSLLAVVTLLHGKQSSHTTGASSPTPVSNTVYTHTEDPRNQPDVLTWSSDGRLTVNQQITTITYATPSGMPINNITYHIETWNALTQQNYHEYEGDSVNTWSSYHWSQDGKYIAYLSSPDVSPKGIGEQTIHAKIVVLDANSSQVLHTSDLMALGPNSAGIPDLSWSSDDTTISLISQDNNANQFALISWNMLTGQQTTMTISNIPLANLSANIAVDKHWSPNGKYIAFSQIDFRQGQVHTFIADTQTGQTTGNYTMTFGTGSITMNPVLGWTANSSQFFFYNTPNLNPQQNLNSMVPGGALQVTSIDPTGQVASDYTLADANAGITGRYWLSPDGKYLASVSEKRNEYELDIWSLAGKKIVDKYLFAEVAVPWTSGQAPPVFAWSPDERYIATAYTDQKEEISILKIALP